jgi:dihydrofolate reductase
MRKIVAAEFMTVDGVMGEVDTWHFPYVNEEMVAEQASFMPDTEMLLLGRQTYQEFAAVWPNRTAKEFGPFAGYLNDTPKLVVSTSLDKAEWQNSRLIRGDVVKELTKLKQQPGKSIVVLGSATLVQSLLRHNLLDELKLLVDPVLVGAGKRLFAESGHRTPLRLVESKTFSTGALSLIYAPANA